MKRIRYLLAFTALVALFCLAISVEGTDAGSTVGDWSYHGISCFRVNENTSTPGVSCVQATGHGYAVIINQQFVAVFNLKSKNGGAVFFKRQP